MQINPREIDSDQAYKILRNLVIPRPIALVSTINTQGLVNVAPFSFYGVVSSDPPVLGIAVGRRKDLEKDTTANARQTRELVVNVVSEDMTEQINLTAMDFPPEESELEAAGFTTRPAVMVKAPLIAEAPAQMECRLVDIIHFGEPEITTDFIMAEVVMFHVQDELWLENRPDTLGLNALARLGDDYFRGSGDPFEFKRIKYHQWKQGR